MDMTHGRKHRCVTSVVSLYLRYLWYMHEHTEVTRAQGRTKRATSPHAWNAPKSSSAPPEKEMAKATAKKPNTSAAKTDRTVGNPSSRCDRHGSVKVTYKGDCYAVEILLSSKSNNDLGRPRATTCARVPALAAISGQRVLFHMQPPMQPVCIRPE